MPFSSRVTVTAALALVTSLVLAGCVGGVEPDDVSTAEATPSPIASESVEAENGSGEVESSSNQGSGGSSDSGGGNSGSGGSGSGDSSGSSASPSQTPAPPAAPGGPTAAVSNQKCSSGKLVITLTANADGSYRKGITAVTLERQNQYDVWLDSPATWLGPETGQGNQWTGDLPGNQQNIGKTLRVTVVGTTGSTTLTLPITAPC